MGREPPGACEHGFK